MPLTHAYVLPFLCDRDEGSDICKSPYHGYLRSMLVLSQNMNVEKYINYQSSEILVFSPGMYFLILILLIFYVDHHRL